MKRIVMGTVLAALLSTIASASTEATSVGHREAWQRARIERGVANGWLTPGEVARVKAGQHRVHRMVLLARGDGVLTPYECFCLTRAQNHQSRLIYRLAHNASTM